MNGAQPHERRRTDRRRGDDRRRTPMPASGDSWFGALAAGGGGRPLSADGFEPEIVDGDQSGVSDSRFLAREARRIVSGEDSALSRIYRAYVAARAVLGAALAVAPWAMSMLGTRLAVPVTIVCLAYAAQSVLMWLLRGSSQASGGATLRLRRREWILTIGVDLLAFSVLHLTDSAQSMNYAALLGLPVLMAGVMTKRLGALATAAFVTLVLLAHVWLAAPAEADFVRLLSQAALAGTGAFVIALIGGEMAQRLSREEQAARGSLGIARQQAQLNRLVLEEMADGVLVIDRRSRVRAANPAARSMLGSAARVQSMSFDLRDEPAWQPLLEAVEQAFAIGRWPQDHRELRLGDDPASRRLVQVRARFTRRDLLGGRHDQPEDVCVLFLEDVRRVQARARQEKLAAMGRMSAGISHEIRNPLAAIAQANALLLEDRLEPAQLKLARIVEDNVGRLKRIIDDVMAAAASGPAQSQSVDAAALVRQVCLDWANTAGLAVGPIAARLAVHVPAGAALVQFDAEHLRRVLVNLLENARRHATEAPGAIEVELSSATPAGFALRVASDGAPIGADVERHLFEPFFSTRSRGTGLGLYICRELCERHGATIDFRAGAQTERHRNVFHVVMRPAQRH